jgi:hypothetical protein
MVCSAAHRVITLVEAEHLCNMGGELSRQKLMERLMTVVVKILQ